MMFRGVPVRRGGLVDDWKSCWRWFSTWLISGLSIAPVVYENSSFLQDFIPATTYHWLTGALGFIALVARLVKQS